MDLNPIIVTFWGQNQEKLQILEKHLSENGIKQWSYYFGFPGQGLKLRISEKEIYYADPNVLRNKYVGQNLTHYGLWAALKMMAERIQKRPSGRLWKMIASWWKTGASHLGKR